MSPLSFSRVGSVVPPRFPASSSAALALALALTLATAVSPPPHSHPHPHPHPPPPPPTAAPTALLPPAGEVFELSFPAGAPLGLVLDAQLRVAGFESPRRHARRRAALDEELGEVDGFVRPRCWARVKRRRR